MATLAESLGEIKKPWRWIAIGGGILLIWAAVALPSMRRSSPASETAHATYSPQVADFYSAPETKAGPASSAPQADVAPRYVAYDAAKAEIAQRSPTPDTLTGRKIIRTSSLEMVVQHPAEAAEKITALAEGMGGYLVTSDNGGQSAAAGTLTVRVPAARFEEARAEIRKLGLRVANEKVDAQDVTRQYVDQDASIRNLRAEEAGYLFILKQATTVKDMLAVSAQLSAVRGQIEQQEAEFNALTRQVDTVAISISLRTETEAQVFGLNWRPGYQIKLALRDGLDSVADYASTLTGILFYLPATLLWVGTVLFAVVASWRAVRWVGRRWFGWTITAGTAQS